MEQRITSEKSTSGLLEAFTAHPASVGESYFEHMGFALRFAGQLFLAGGAALIHAVLPFCCEKTASQRIRKMYAKIEHRG